MLKKNDIEAWLEDVDGNALPHGRPTTRANEISATVEIEAGKTYVVHWRRAAGSRPISAWNDVFVVDASSRARKAAASWMNEREPATQTGSSERLEVRFRNGLKTPRLQSENLGAVRLHIRRARGQIRVECVKDHPDDPDNTGMDEVDIDLIDDGAQGKLPWIIFNFIFKNIAHHTTRPRTSGARGVRASPPDVALWSDDDGDDDVPLRPLTRQQARQAYNAKDDTPSDSSDPQSPPSRRLKRHRNNPPSETDSSHDEDKDNSPTPPPRKPKRRRNKSVTPSESSPNENPEAVIQSRQHRRDFPTPVSHRAPDDADEEAAILRRQTEAAERAFEEEMRQFQKGNEIEQLYKKQVEIDKKKKKLRSEAEAQKRRIAKLRREMSNT